MAEDEGKKNEEKFEFTHEGEVLGYISLDQARVLAMRTAREAPGNYGPNFRDAIMAFEINEEADTEDHYVITLSYRPQGDFTGSQGQEQFFIQKEGIVAHRQVLSLPATGIRAEQSLEEPASQDATDQFVEGMGDIGAGFKDFVVGLWMLFSQIVGLLWWLFRLPIHIGKWLFRRGRRDIGPPPVEVSESAQGIEYTCEDCGHLFPSGTIRRGPKYCGHSPGASDCAGTRRQKGMGARQTDPSGPSLQDSVGNLSFEAMLDLCRQRSAEIYVGYSGGGAALRQAMDGELRATRTWRWHNPMANGRVADPENWIPGTWFLAIVEDKLQVSN